MDWFRYTHLDRDQSILHSTAQHMHCLQPIVLLSLLYNIHFNVTLEGGSTAGQPRNVAVLLYNPALISLKTHVNPVQILSSRPFQSMVQGNPLRFHPVHHHCHFVLPVPRIPFGLCCTPSTASHFPPATAPQGKAGQSPRDSGHPPLPDQAQVVWSNINAQIEPAYLGP